MYTYKARVSCHILCIVAVVLAVGKTRVLEARVPVVLVLDIMVEAGREQDADE
jgi:hypothetical protein